MLYNAVVYAVRLRVPLALAMGNDKPGDSWFAANGMCLTFEHPMKPDHRGLLEIGTPECEDAETLALRMVSIDNMLAEAMADASVWLASQDFVGTLHLVKSNRDADGERFGRQDNRSIPLPGGFARWRYRAVLLGPGVLLAVAVPAVMALSFATFFFFAMSVLVGGVVAYFGLVVLLSVRAIVTARRLEDVPGAHLLRPSEATVTRGFNWVLLRLLGLFGPLNNLLTIVVSAVSRSLYCDVEGPLQGFVVSRAALTGSGHVLPSGDLILSGKVDATTNWWPRRWRLDGHAVWLGHHILRAFVAKWPRTAWAGFRDVFTGPVRMQLGGVDSNRAPFAEALSVVSLARVVDLAVAGKLADAPRFADPLAAMKTLNADVTLQASVPDVSGRTWTALELQRFYHQRAVAEHPHDDWVTAWGEAIDGLSADPMAWVGRIDWVTKRYLLDQVASEASWAVRKRVDLGYHELGGLYDRLVDALDVPSLWSEAELADAVVTPPSGPAGRRGALIREHGEALAGVSWTQVRLPGRVVWLHDR